ncbi:uncharacterized protein N7459_003341 [Penicillium hispanicum]|uniref:uncharacterized protein n=1 Tax=Penicillium hispanicum TaxID=1080232 RepID=UPI0025411118|nr:uncharacterized protein N7459_003341 [Penicillium hispanicum]KAJ5587576.1 hypothetical protein N7459_003341 [Penicillium hispanicum]
MLRCAAQHLSPLHNIRSPRVRSFYIARYFHQVTTDFITRDTRGSPVTKKVPIIIGNPGEAYVLIDRGVGIALHAASPFSSASAASAEDRCKLTFFHDSQHFGFGPSSYPRLYIPHQLPRQTELNTSPATLFLAGKMHEIVLDGTPDATFAEHATASVRNLGTVLDQLKDM